VIGLIKRNFIHMDSRTFIMLHKAMVRPHVDYANSIWSPYKKRDIEAIEKVQKRATKLVISLKKLPYKERLSQLNLHTLKYRRLRGDTMEVIIRVIINGDGGCSFWQPVQGDSQPKSSGLVLGRRPLGAVLHSSNEPGELSQWLCHDDSTINIVMIIIIIIQNYTRYV